MRIGIVCHASVGGSGRIGTELANQLACRGHEVHLFALMHPFNLTHLHKNLKVHTLKPLDTSRQHLTHLHITWSADETEQFIAKIIAVAASDGLDILHFHYALPFAFIVQEVCRQLQPEPPLTVGTLHGSDVLVHGRDPHMGPQLAAALAEIDLVTTVSEAHASLTQQVFSALPKPVVIPNFIDMTYVNRSEGHVSSNHRARLIHVSNFREVKDPVGAAMIFLEMRKHMDLDLWLVGDGEEMGQVRAMLDQAGVNDHVRYFGPTREVLPLLQQADLLLATSRYESFCMAALEAMACGVPVLATRVGGLPEVVHHGETGILFPPEQYVEAACKGLELLENRTQHDAFRAAARNRASQFDAARIIPLYEDAYCNISQKIVARC